MMPSVSVRPRRLPAARRRSQLLDVALERFGASGYHATSMEDIAERAGVTKPVLYQHFPSKRELYRELIESVGQELLDTVTAASGGQPDPFQRVREGFRAYFRFVREHTAAFGLLFGARQADEFAGAVQAVERSIAETIAGLIDVDLAPDHRDLLGLAIVGLAEVTSRQWVERADAAGPLDAAEGELRAERLADLVWAGLRALPAGASGS